MTWLFRKMILMGEEPGEGRLVRRLSQWSWGRRVRVGTRTVAVELGREGEMPAQEN